MHAIRQHEFGPASVLRYETAEDPVPGAGQVRIAVAAAGVHLIDTKIRAGERMGPMPLPELPMTPGREVAGSIDQVGSDVDETWLGRRVVGHLGPASGGYAELAIRDVDALHAIPDGLADDAAVAMIGTGRTTMGVLATAQLTSDDVVLVTSAAGGVGGLLVQAARRVGATVVGVAGGAAKVEHVRGLGATVAVDYTASGWADEVRSALAGRPVTTVFDMVGGEHGRTALELLGRGGRAFVLGWSSGRPTTVDGADIVERGITVAPAFSPELLSRGVRPLEERALAAAARGELTPVVSATFPLARAADAHQALESRATIGKVVLKP